MPFTPYQSSFDAETLATLQAAFDMAWADMAAKPDFDVEDQSVRNALARRIVDAWRERGERDPERLRQYALEAFDA